MGNWRCGALLAGILSVVGFDQRIFGLELPFDYVVVSDIDDTIKMSRARPDGHYFDMVRRIANLHGALVGMPEIFRFLHANGADIKYVSATPTFVQFWADLFLKVSGFPPGELITRRSIRDNKGEFKFQAIRAMVVRDPTRPYVLIGDDGESDAEAFRRLRHDSEIGHLIAHIYIHHVYGSSRSAVDASEEDISGFLTAADLALTLEKDGLLQPAQSSAALNTIAAALVAGDGARVLPEYTVVQPADVSGYYPREAQAPWRNLIAAIEHLARENLGARQRTCETLLTMGPKSSLP